MKPQNHVMIYYATSYLPLCLHLFQEELRTPGIFLLLPQLPSHDISPHLHHIIPTDSPRVAKLTSASTLLTSKFEAMEHRLVAVDDACRGRKFYKLNRLGSSGLAFCTYLC